MPLPRLLLVTDRRRARMPLVQAVSLALDALPRGSAAVLLREKDLEGRALLALARQLREAAGDRALFFVSGRFDVALAGEADGVHLGGEAPWAADVRAVTGDRLRIGVSLHAGDSADPAADYALLSPVFATPSKPGAVPLGLERFRAEAARLPLPVFALGGIDCANARACVQSGAHGVAVLGAVLAAGDPASAAAALWTGLTGGRSRL